jgi:hypothetical protein
MSLATSQLTAVWYPANGTTREPEVWAVTVLVVIANASRMIAHQADIELTVALPSHVHLPIGDPPGAVDLLENKGHPHCLWLLWCLPERLLGLWIDEVAPTFVLVKDRGSGIGSVPDSELVINDDASCVSLITKIGDTSTLPLQLFSGCHFG